MKLPWVMKQTWAHLLYVHTRVDAQAIRELVPPELEIDTYDGSPWITLIPLHMERVHLRDTIPIPGTRRFPELNLRTYVRHGDRSGVWFLSIDASSWFSVKVARRAFSLPYRDASMSFEQSGKAFRFRSVRKDADDVEFRAEYEPTGDATVAVSGSLNEFLAERYCMFAQRPSGELLRGDISHRPWEISSADAQISHDTVIAAAGLRPRGAPVLAYSAGTTAVAWPMVRATD